MRQTAADSVHGLLPQQNGREVTCRSFVIVAEQHIYKKLLREYIVDQRMFRLLCWPDQDSVLCVLRLWLAMKSAWLQSDADTVLRLCLLRPRQRCSQHDVTLSASSPIRTCRSPTRLRSRRAASTSLHLWKYDLSRYMSQWQPNLVLVPGSTTVNI